MRTLYSMTAFSLFLWMCCCSTDKEKVTFAERAEMRQAASENALVTKVEYSGVENAYTFTVTIQSPDTGCDQYADWWEVIDLEGNLLYRRILAHSHVNEQPFARSGGPVEILENTEVYVRAHMNTSGYGSIVLKGSVASGFISTELDINFAKTLQDQTPLPAACAF